MALQCKFQLLCIEEANNYVYENGSRILLMTHSQLAWTIYGLWLGAAVIYVTGGRIDFIKKHKLIWWLCATPMVAPMFVLATIALFVERPVELIFKKASAGAVNAAPRQISVAQTPKS
jgi:hypothetical protein